MKSVPLSTMSEASDIKTLKAELLVSSKCPPWLEELLAHVPRSPADVVPHNKPTLPAISNKIADAFLHPAIEACLHLINTDLYSAHFLVRKAQGGAKYIDWLHAILHKLEGDSRNAKMWYTDLGNSTSCPAFTQFWSTSSGAGVVSLTAAQHTDLVALVSAKPGSFRPEEYHTSTTTSADKIRDSGAAFSLAELEKLVVSNTPGDETGDVMQLELIWLLHRMQSEFGWAAMDAAQTTAALQEQARRNDADPDSTQRKDQAHNMVFDASGQRKF